MGCWHPPAHATEARGSARESVRGTPLSGGGEGPGPSLCSSANLESWRPRAQLQLRPGTGARPGAGQCGGSPGPTSQERSLAAAFAALKEKRRQSREAASAAAVAPAAAALPGAKQGQAAWLRAGRQGRGGQAGRRGDRVLRVCAACLLDGVVRQARMAEPQGASGAGVGLMLVWMAPQHQDDKAVRPCAPLHQRLRRVRGCLLPWRHDLGHAGRGYGRPETRPTPPSIRPAPAVESCRSRAPLGRPAGQPKAAGWPLGGGGVDV